MNIGMLWFDNDRQASIPKKVTRAAEYYQRKYGRDPDLCFVHPRMFEQELNQKEKPSQPLTKPPVQIGKVKVVENEKILPDHFWIGVSTEEERVSLDE